ncbi:MAG: phosphatidylserine decarboxylase family protein [Bacteroidales bacterium]|nr:phosphatidylserine decarboxylase family protein [Bacteroidales bacterium]
MYIHKEGHRLLGWLGLVLLAAAALIIWFEQYLNIWFLLLWAIVFILWSLLLYFFRIPKRNFVQDESLLISPADGTICAIEQVFEKEYLNCECLQVSVFMYGTDVHVNRYPVSGHVDYVKYHKGNYFVASYPKSSVLNEHSSIGLTMSNGQKILMKQIAGVMARRIVCYAKEGEDVKQNQELGFIKFGSRVDLFLPLGTELSVKLQDKVKNGLSTLAKL